MAQAVPATSQQHLQEFLSNMAWDEELLNRQRVQWMVATATLGHGVLHLYELGFPKQGKASVGVARQYSCHAATVMLAYSFLVWLELGQRRGPKGRGRPRHSLSPTTGPQARPTSSSASAGGPVATPPGCTLVGDDGSVHGALLTQVLTK